MSLRRSGSPIFPYTTLFRSSHLDGAMHRFTPEISMRVQHEIGADIMFAFDELTTLINTRSYQDRKSTRLNSSHVASSYAVFGFKKKILHEIHTHIGADDDLV